MIKEIEQQLKVIKQYILKEFDQLAIILFGSYSKNLGSSEGDIKQKLNIQFYK